MIKLLVFDLDGTLVDTRRDITTSVNHVLTEYGFPEQSMETVTAAVGGGIENLMVRCAKAAGVSEDFEQGKLFKRFRSHYT
ncbi:HAD family hydrolase, partial [Fibrobacterota bacterium]